MYKQIVLCMVVGHVAANFVFNDTVFMPKLDRQVTQDMLEPQPGGGPKLLKDAFFFHQNMDAAADLTEAKDKRGEEVYLDLMRDGGPHFIKRSYDRSELEKAFKWGADELEEFTAILGAVEEDWNRLEKLAIEN